MTGGGDHVVRVWDLARGELIGEPIRGHEGTIDNLVVTEIIGQPVAITAGRDSTTRVWGLDLSG